jgi:hypothetical protein
MNTSLYDADLNAWLNQQVEYLQAKQFDKLDIDNIIEELEAVRRMERRCMESHFTILLALLLKARYQPEMSSETYLLSLVHSRMEIEAIIEDSPSMKEEMQTIFEKSWDGALSLAITGTGTEEHQYPTTCPWNLHEAMEEKIDKYFVR